MTAELVTGWACLVCKRHVPEGRYPCPWCNKGPVARLMFHQAQLELDGEREETGQT